MLLDTVKKTVTEQAMLPDSGTVVVAVSGGPDSVCLLSVLRHLATDRNLSLHVAHLDHGLRGEASAGEASFVAELARRFGIPATVEQRDVAAYCADRGMSLPAGAREVRYAFLESVADRVGAARIAVGHTATDQAETVLMRLLRGAGLSGLSGIPPVRGRIVRPLIGVTREEILRHLAEEGLPYVNDPTNADTRYLRNRIRHELLPVLRAYNPGIVGVLAGEAALLREDEETLAAAAEEASQRITRPQENSVRIERHGFLTLPRALQRRILRRTLSRFGAEPAGLSSLRTDEILAFLRTAQTGRSLLLPAGIEVLREYDAFVVRLRPPAGGFCIPLAVPGSTTIRELSLVVVTEAVAQERAGAGLREAEKKDWQALFDYDKIGPFLLLRSRRPGDRFRPSGMPGTRKLQDYFVDRKVPRRLRDRVPLLTSGDEIAWVVGMQRDARFVPGPETKRILRVTVKEETGLR